MIRSTSVKSQIPPVTRWSRQEPLEWPCQLPGYSGRGDEYPTRAGCRKSQHWLPSPRRGLRGPLAPLLRVGRFASIWPTTSNFRVVR